MGKGIIVKTDFECPRCGSYLYLVEKDDKVALKCPKCKLKSVWKLDEVFQMVLRNRSGEFVVDLNNVLCELYFEFSIKSLIEF